MGETPLPDVPGHVPATCVEVATAGRVGTNLGQVMNLHNLAIDSKGNVYTAEVQGKRVQRFRNLGGL